MSRECAATQADSATAVTERNGESAVQAHTSAGCEDEPSNSNSHTIQAHIDREFTSSRELNVTATTVRESLGSVPATERKFGLTAGGGSSAAADSNEFLLVQVSALNALLSKTLGHQCFQPAIAVVPETRLGLAMKMALCCFTCGVSEAQLSSLREEGSRAFEVNLRFVHEIRSIGKGSTALTDLVCDEWHTGASIRRHFWGT